MMDDKILGKILDIAEKKTTLGSVVFYDDFYHDVPQFDRFFLSNFRIFLENKGYVYHARASKCEWGICGYDGEKSHFHRKSDLENGSKRQPVILKCPKCHFEIKSDWLFCPHCGHRTS